MHERDDSAPGIRRGGPGSADRLSPDRLSLDFCRCAGSYLRFSGRFPVPGYIALFAILIIIWLNLCGMRNSCTTFAIPTYTFVAGVLPIVIVGLVRYFHLFGVTPMALTQEVELPPPR